MSNEKLIAALPLAALFAAVAMSTPPASAQEGMVVTVDPQTKQLRAPTPAEMKTLATPQQSLVAPAQHTVIARPDQVRQVRLGAKGQVYEVVTRDADGKLVQQCVQGESAASAALQQPAATKEHRHEDQ
jgi:hypothetical protein